MGQAYIGEIRMMAFPFAPKNWALCNGQQLPINQNQALYSILGTTYGGNGQTTFALPNLQGRAPVHVGTGPGLPSANLGTAAGEAAHTLTGNETAAHTHLMKAATAPNANSVGPNGAFLGASPQQLYTSTAATTVLAGTVVTQNTGGQPHNNLQPFQVVSFCICLFGIFPSRN